MKAPAVKINFSKSRSYFTAVILSNSCYQAYLKQISTWFVIKYITYLPQEPYCKTINFPHWKLNMFCQMAAMLFPALNSASQKTDTQGCKGMEALDVKWAGLKSRAHSLELCNWHLFQLLNMNLFDFQSLTFLLPSSILCCLCHCLHKRCS